MTAMLSPHIDPDFHHINPANPLAEVRRVEDDPDEPAIFSLILTKKQTREYRRRLVERGAGCVYCGCNVTDGEATTEHAVPQCQGGGNQPSNLFVSCAPCNSERWAQSLPKWVATMRRDAENLLMKADRIERAGQHMGVIPKPDTDDFVTVATTG